MKRFKLTIYRQVSERADVYIEAKDFEDAEYKYHYDCDTDHSENANWKATSVGNEEIIDIEEV